MFFFPVLFLAHFSLLFCSVCDVSAEPQQGVNDSNNTANIYCVITLCFMQTSSLSAHGTPSEAVNEISLSGATSAFLERHKPGSRRALKLINLVLSL